MVKYKNGDNSSFHKTSFLSQKAHLETSKICVVQEKHHRPFYKAPGTREKSLKEYHIVKKNMTFDQLLAIYHALLTISEKDS